MKGKILYFVNTGSFFLSHRAPIATAAISEGFEVHVASSTKGRSKELELLGFIAHEISIDRKSAGLLSNAVTFLQIFSLFLKIRPDIVHLITIKPILLGGFAARLLSIPCLVVAVSGLGTVFTSVGLFAKLRLYLVRLAYSFIFKHPNCRVIFQNKSDLACILALTKISEEKTELIKGSGVDLEKYSYLPFPNQRPHVVFASRLLKEKGVTEFVEAAKKLKLSPLKPLFVIAGEPDRGNSSTITQKELEAWQSENLVDWRGYIDDIPSLFSKCQIVVLPSYYGEGVPKVLLEAAACGRAIVTTDHPGCRDAIKPNETGLLVPTKNADALADAISFLIENPSVSKRMGFAAREFAEKAFDIRTVVETHLSIYDDLLTTRRK